MKCHLKVGRGNLDTALSSTLPNLQCVPEGRHICGRSRQGERDCDFFQIRQYHNGHDDAKHPAGPICKEHEHHSSDENCRCFCPPGVITSQPPEPQKTHDGCSDVTTNPRCQPYALLANHFGPQPPSAEG